MKKLSLKTINKVIGKTANIKRIVFELSMKIYELAYDEYGFYHHKKHFYHWLFS